ncbi:MAG: hypothetical protein EHM37_15110 [Deltaproteobacteria bacterium]|nr:MAG: hypothetical protein EHM37_15110 [Deltaproteobacteria bacterium]
MDPFYGNIRDPLSLHKYVYAQANPANMSDPLGLFSLAGTLVTATIAATLVILESPNIANAPGFGDVSYMDASGDIVANAAFDAAGGKVLKWGGTLVRYVGRTATTYLSVKGSTVAANLVRSFFRAHPRSGLILYGTLDHLDRPTGVIARVTRNMLRQGTTAADAIVPYGYDASLGHAKGHLLAKVLGGSGELLENFITMMQNPTNNSTMKAIELAIRDAVDLGEVVDVVVRPIYIGGSRTAHKIAIVARGNRGLSITAEIANPL